MASTDAGSRTSTYTGRMPLPSPPRATVSTSAAATRAPAAANASAVALPMPDAAPVTSTARLLRSRTVTWSRADGGRYTAAAADTRAVSRSVTRSATRRAFAMMVNVGFTAELETKKLESAR